MRDDDLLDALTRDDPFDPDREIPRRMAGSIRGDGDSVTPNTAVITMGTHAMQFTWCGICHAMISVRLVSPGNNQQYQAAMDAAEAAHYRWHRRETA